jgi:hypothetical protein
VGVITVFNDHHQTQVGNRVIDRVPTSEHHCGFIGKPAQVRLVPSSSRHLTMGQNHSITRNYFEECLVLVFQITPVGHHHYDRLSPGENTMCKPGDEVCRPRSGLTISPHYYSPGWCHNDSRTWF